MSETPTETKTRAKPPGFIAIVEKYAAPNEPRPIEFVEAQTKRDLKVSLADPSIATVRQILRGRKIDFKESRHVAF